jgi:hypothetical protein
MKPLTELIQKIGEGLALKDLSANRLGSIELEPHLFNVLASEIDGAYANCQCISVATLGGVFYFGRAKPKCKSCGQTVPR